MKDDRDVALGWLRKADSDLANAELCLAAEKSLDTACFHCQQAAEKALKAYLIVKHAEFPLTHDLKRYWIVVRVSIPRLTRSRTMRCV
jgi:HEPN domain-containing protein